MKKNKKGFTLVELLVVIAIIAILATLAIVALQQARKSARDAKRIADVRQMQTALELYFNDWGGYPATADVVDSIASGTYVYMVQIPTAPTPPDGTHCATKNDYDYTAVGSAPYGSYTIQFCLGGQTGGYAPEAYHATPGGIFVQD